MNKKISIIQCNSIQDLPIGVILKLVKKDVKLIYDAHELETEKQELSGLSRFIAKITEKLLIKYIDQMMVVSESILQWYREVYKIDNISLVRNMPYNIERNLKSRSPVFSTKFNIENAIIFLYQGTLMNGRGIDLLLQVFANINKNKHIVFMGYGQYEDKIKVYSAQYSNIHFHEAVAIEEILLYANGADVGLSLIENICLSYYYCLPNKLFEYIISGLPVIVSNFPDMAEIINEYNVGWKVNVTYPEVYKIIDALTIEEINEKKKNSIDCCNLFSWANEEKKFMEIYQSLKR
ncbi:glycosyltransferase family 4 protein [Candidatus Amoebophilus asiaticus]|nr:glycosyltransferase family 4 protein [Candidatus Amoebophilus asiaticus]